MNVLIATDGSEEIYSASRLAAAIIRPQSVSHFIILSVTWPPHEAPIWNEAMMRWVLVDDIHHAIALVATEAMQRIEGELRPLEVPVERLIKARDPAQTILEVAEQYDVELIVIGRHAQNPTAKSVSTKVLAKGTLPRPDRLIGGDRTRRTKERMTSLDPRRHAGAPEREEISRVFSEVTHAASTYSSFLRKFRTFGAL